MSNLVFCTQSVSTVLETNTLFQFGHKQSLEPHHEFAVPHSLLRSFTILFPPPFRGELRTQKSRSLLLRSQSYAQSTKQSRDQDIRLSSHSQQSDSRFCYASLIVRDCAFNFRNPPLPPPPPAPPISRTSTKVKYA